MEDALQGDALSITRAHLMESIDRIPHAKYVQRQKEKNAKRKQPASDGDALSKMAKLF